MSCNESPDTHVLCNFNVMCFRLPSSIESHTTQSSTTSHLRASVHPWSRTWWLCSRQYKREHHSWLNIAVDLPFDAPKPLRLSHEMQCRGGDMIENCSESSTNFAQQSPPKRCGSDLHVRNTSGAAEAAVGGSDLHVLALGDPIRPNLAEKTDELGRSTCDNYSGNDPGMTL